MNKFNEEYKNSDAYKYGDETEPLEVDDIILEAKMKEELTYYRDRNVEIAVELRRILDGIPMSYIQLVGEIEELYNNYVVDDPEVKFWMKEKINNKEENIND